MGKPDFRHNVLVRFDRKTGKFLAVVEVTADRVRVWELKNKYNMDYPVFRYEIFWPERPEL